MATPQWCPSDAPITYQENQPTWFAAPTGLTACGYPVGTYDPNYFAAIDSASFGDTGASGGNGAGGGGEPCGACAALFNSANGDSVTVTIVDECPQGGVNQNNCWPGSYHLDLSHDAYNVLSCGSPGCAGNFPSNTGTNSDTGSTVSWKFVQCPLTGNAAVTFANSTGKIAYEWGNGSKSGYSPLMFLDTLFPIASITVNGANETRDSSNQNPDFWGGLSGYSGTLTVVLTSYETSVGPVTLTVNGSSYSPIQSSPPGTTSAQFNACVTGPTSTPTKTPTIGSPTATFTNTFTTTPTATLTPISGCPFYYYNGTAPHALANGAIPYQGNATLTETAGAAYTGDAAGMNIAFNVPAATFFGEVEWNWANYTATNDVNLASFSTLEFYVDDTTAGALPMTLNVYLSDYAGAGSTGQTQSNPVTVILTTTGYQKIDIPLSSFSSGGTSYTPTTIGEIDFKWSTSTAAQTATVYVDNIAFYGTCPTATPTPSSTFTRTDTSTPTKTATTTATYTITNTPTFSATASPTSSRTNTATSTVTATPTNTSASTSTPTTTPTKTSTSTTTLTATGTQTGTPTNTLVNTGTPTATATKTPTSTATSTTTNTVGNTATLTPTSSATRTASLTPSATVTNTPANSFTPSSTPTLTASGTPTGTLGNTATRTPTLTATSTLTATASRTASFTPSATVSATATRTASSTSSATVTDTPVNSFTPTGTPTVTASSTSTGTPLATATLTPSSTVTGTPTSTASATATQTATMTPVATSTSTPADTFTTTSTPTMTPSGTSTGTATPSATATVSSTGTSTRTSTASSTATGTSTATRTATASSTATLTQTATVSATPSRTATATLSSTPTLTTTSTRTASPTATVSNTATNTASGTPSASPTVTVTRTPTSTITPTPTITETRTETTTPTATFPVFDVFSVSENLFKPSNGPVSIQVAYSIFPGDYSLKIFNSAGEHIKTLDSQYLTKTITQTYQWDGKNKYGADCASGVYIFYLSEPYSKKIKRIILVR